MKVLALVLFCLNVILAAVSSACLVFSEAGTSTKMLQVLAFLVNALSAVNLYTRCLM